MIDVVFEYFIDEPVAYARVANFSNPLICHPEDSVGALVGTCWNYPLLFHSMRAMLSLANIRWATNQGLLVWWWWGLFKQILTRKLYFCMNLLRNNLVHCSVPTKLPNRAAYILIAVDGCLSRSCPPNPPGIVHKCMIKDKYLWPMGGRLLRISILSKFCHVLLV